MLCIYTKFSYQTIMTWKLKQSSTFNNISNIYKKEKNKVSKGRSKTKQDLLRSYFQ